jgi:predicted nucleotidyltransferase
MKGETTREATELDRVHALVHDFARLVREHFGERVRDVWLYGSAARGDWTTDSDIDVLVLLYREEQGDIEWLVETAYGIGLSEHRLLLQPVLLTTEEFDHLAARERRFARDVLREGIAA